MSENIKAKAASIRASGSQLAIVLTFGEGLERQRVEYSYNGDDVARFATELLRQKARAETVELLSGSATAEVIPDKPGPDITLLTDIPEEVP